MNAADMTGAVLTGASLRNAGLKETVLRKADISNTNLEGPPPTLVLNYACLNNLQCRSSCCSIFICRIFDAPYLDPGADMRFADMFAVSAHKAPSPIL